MVCTRHTLFLPLGKDARGEAGAGQRARCEAHLKSNSLRSYWNVSGWFTIILITLLLTTVFASLLDSLLRFDRPSINQGEIWRMFTGHFVHLGAYHALMNIIGLILIWSMFPAALDNRNLPKATLFIALSISVALWIFSPQLEWYSGFSGVLHGLLAFGIVLHLRRGMSIYWLALVALMCKVIHEQLPGYDASYLMNYIHAPVAVDAHIYGTLAGLIWGVFVRYRATPAHVAPAVQLDWK